MQNPHFDEHQPYAVPGSSQPVHSHEPAQYPQPGAQPPQPAPDTKPHHKERRHFRPHFGPFGFYFMICGMLTNAFLLGWLIVKIFSLFGSSIH